MKKLYPVVFFLLIGAGSFAQTFYNYTATKSGNWNDMSVWNIVVRTDGVHKTKVVIPNPYIIAVDNGVNGFGLGDVDINIYGSLSLQPSTVITLSSLSSVQLYGTGSIIGTTASQAISIGGVSKYNGSLDHTKTGASIASSASGVSPMGFLSTSLLPVVFSSFTVAKEANEMVLQWSTASEVSNDYFEVQRSYNGNVWTTLSTVKGTGSATGSANYSYTDNANAGTVYYRLKQVDVDGVFSYSTVKTVNGGSTVAAKIYGADKTLTVELNTPVTKAVVITVMNTSGQVLERKQFSAGYKISMQVNNNQSGIVVVNVADNNGLNQTAKLFL